MEHGAECAKTGGIGIVHNNGLGAKYCTSWMQDACAVVVSLALFLLVPRHFPSESLNIIPPPQKPQLHQR
jgi:hypothetical protein